MVPAPTSRSYPCISAQPRSAQYVCKARRRPWKSLGALAFGIGRGNVDAVRRLRKLRLAYTEPGETAEIGRARVVWVESGEAGLEFALLLLVHRRRQKRHLVCRRRL